MTPTLEGYNEKPLSATKSAASSTSSSSSSSNPAGPSSPPRSSSSSTASTTTAENVAYNSATWSHPERGNEKNFNPFDLQVSERSGAERSEAERSDSRASRSKANFQSPVVREKRRSRK